MTTSLRARALIAAGVLAVAFASAPVRPVGAAPADASLSTHDLQITPVGAGNQPSTDSRLAVAMDPGASTVRSFVVVNRTSGLRLTVRFAAVDATAAADGGVTFARDASPAGAANWLSLSDVVATLEPKAELRVSVTIAPPGNAEPGTVFVGVVARVDRSVRMADGADGPKSDPVSLPVAVEVKGAATALVSVVGVNAVKDHGRSYLEVTFQNGGATANTMAGTLKVLGAHPKSLDLRANVAPLTHTTERVPYDLPSGDPVSVSVDTQDAGGNQAAWTGKVGAGVVPVRSTVAKARGAHAAASTSGGHHSLFSRLLALLVVLACVSGAGWFVAELRRSRRGRVACSPGPARGARRVRRPKSTPIAIPVALLDGSGADAPRGAPAPTPAPAFVSPFAPATASTASTASAAAAVSTDAVVAQLSASVHAIDRLVSRLGEVLPGTERAAPSAPPGPPAETTPAEPAPSAAAVARAESGAILYAPAAPNPEPAAFEPPAFDPYDWPSEAQLDEFIAKRNTGPADPR